VEVTFVDVDGTLTRCVTAGHRERYPILLLHGYGGTADIWLQTIDALGDEFYVVAPDMISSGFTDLVETDGPPQPYAVAHLAKLADALGFASYCVSGTSYGGLIAALLYFAQPTRVDKLILNGSGTCFNDDAALKATLTNMLRNFGPLMEHATIEGCRASMIKQVYDPASVPESILPVMATAYARPGMKRAWENGIHGLLDFEAGRQYTVRERLHTLDVDTLLAWGREDPGAIYEMAVAALPRLPRAELYTFEKCGHKPMIEHADRYNAVVRAFLHKGRCDSRDAVAVPSHRPIS
jgi:2-hydroxy-6-oxonona-2,4-dienedioate hydrolase